MSLKSRVNKLEDAHGGPVHKYTLVVYDPDGWAGMWDTPEERAKGYKIQPNVRGFDGTGEPPFYLATWPDVEQFAARPDVDLTVIRVGYADANQDAQEGQE